MAKTRPRILLLGSTGQVGWELQRTLSPLGEVIAASRDGNSGPVVDLSVPDSLVQLFDEVRPNWVVNAAAYTAVDKAEQESDLAAAVNADAPAIIGELASLLGATVVHFSTDYVFDGKAQKPYREGDTTAPLGVYGQTKLLGEQALLDSGADALVLRTSWVYGRHGHNFLKTMLRLFQEREELSVVDDQIGSPTWSRMIAEATAQILAQLRLGQLGERRGIYHLTAAGQTSWYGFAKTILETSGESCHLSPITTADYPTPAVRPHWSVLDNSKLQETFGLTLPDWSVSLNHCLVD
ncbi:dTDP-4-dehydrorhamnose reductase [Pseudomonadota bacterium]